MNLRRVISLTMLFAFATMVTTGIVLYIVPHGRVAYWAGWTLFGLSKEQWGDVHTTMGLLMLLAGVLHVFYNWRSIMVYLKTRSRELRVFTPAFNAALILTTVVVVFTLAKLPPVAWVVDIGSGIKDRASLTYGEPPYGHAELSTLATFTRRMTWDESVCLDNLRAAGFAVEGGAQTLLEVADANGVTPQAVYEAMRPTRPAAGGLPAAAPAGMGRKNLSVFCEDFGVDLNAVVAILGTEGIPASGSSTFKKLAEDHGRSPHDLYTIVREGLDGRD